MNKEEIKKTLVLCVDCDCDQCTYNDINGCYNKIKTDALNLIIEQEKEITQLKAELKQLETNAEILARGVRDLNHENCEKEEKTNTLKTALRWYMDMYGCRPERNVYDGNVEYSCNGYVTNKEDATALLKAKQTLDWFE